MLKAVLGRAGLGYDSNKAGPGADGFLDDAILHHPAYFQLCCLAVGVWDPVGPLLDNYSGMGHGAGDGSTQALWITCP